MIQKHDANYYTNTLSDLSDWILVDRTVYYCHITFLQIFMCVMVMAPILCLNLFPNGGTPDDYRNWQGVPNQRRTELGEVNATIAKLHGLLQVPCV